LDAPAFDLYAVARIHLNAMVAGLKVYVPAFDERDCALRRFEIKNRQ
jgi:hypothetical protein